MCKLLISSTLIYIYTFLKVFLLGCKSINSAVPVVAFEIRLDIMVYVHYTAP